MKQDRIPLEEYFTHFRVLANLDKIKKVIYFIEAFPCKSLFENQNLAHNIIFQSYYEIVSLAFSI